MRLTTSDAAPAAVHEPRRESVPIASGARSSALLGAASVAGIGASYVFLLAAGRILGSEDYGSLAALIGLLSVVLLPAGAVQMAVSRDVSRLLAAGDSAGAEAFAWATLRLALIATIPLAAVALALAVPLSHLLHIGSPAIVVLAETALLTTLVAPVALGVLQGRGRFHALAVMLVLPFAGRLAILAGAAAAGYRLGGAVLAVVLAAFATTALALVLQLEPLRRGARQARPELRAFLRYLAPVAVGLIGTAVLTNLDVLIVKARFSAADAGAYAAASAFARVGFFLPATILSVLFPRTAARQARGEETEDILGRSLLATVVFCAGLALFYSAAGVGLVVTTFGAEFAPGGQVLAPYALAIGLYSVANILVGYHLSRGEARYAWIVAGGVLVQVAVLALVPSSLHDLVWANVGVGVLLLAAHELLVGSSAPAIRAGLRHVQGATAAVRRTLPEALLVLLGATAFVCALFWPVVSHLGSTIVGNPGADATGTIAGLWETRHEGGFHLLGTAHHTLTGAPFGWDETNALNLQVFLTYYPTYLMAKVVGDVAAYNLTILSGYVLSGVAMYVLVRYLGCARLVAAWAGLAYIVFPWHRARVEHGSLLHIEVLALLVLALVAAARRPSWPRFGLVGAATLACWLGSGYFGPMAVVTVAAFTVGAALVSDPRRGAFVAFGSTICAFAATALVGIATFASGTNTGVGLKRSPGDLSIFGIRPVELVVPPPRNVVLGDRLDAFWHAHDHGANPTETANYLGLLTFALALSWLVLAVRRRKTLDRHRRLATAGLAAAFVAGLAFAAPSPILLFGHLVWMPARLLWEVVPAFRVNSRWDPLLMTTLLPLAALGLQAIWSAVTQSGRRLLPLGAAVVVGAMVVSFFELSLKAGPYFRTVPVPPEYAAVERTPRGILAEYPLGYSDIFRLWQRDHGRPLFNGTQPDTAGDYARLRLLDPAQPGTAQSLSLLGVTAIGIHPGAHVDAEVLPREPTGLPGYRLAGRFPDGASIWQVVAPPAPALAALTGGFARPARRPDGFVGYGLVSPAGVGALELWAQAAGAVRVTFETRSAPEAHVTLRVTDPRSEQRFPLAGNQRVSVLVDVPRGHSRLLLKVEPPPTSPQTTIQFSAPRTETASGQPMLHAELISAEPGF